MSRSLLIAFFLIAVSGSNADSQQMNASDSPCPGIVSTVESVNCFYSAFQKADHELNDAYASVRRVLNPNEMDALRSAQRLWLQFRDANCAAEKALYDGGTAVNTVHNACMEAVTRRRVGELNTMYGWRIEKFQSVYPPGPMPEEGNCTKQDGSTRPDCPQAVAFFDNLKAALRANDRAVVASLIEYPLLTNLDKVHSYVQNREALLKNFDRVFDPGVRCAILSVSSRQVWGNSHGFSIGHGEIWFDGVIPANEIPDTAGADYWTKYPIKLITINNGTSLTPCKLPG